VVGAGGGGFPLALLSDEHQEVTRFMQERRCKRIEYSLDEIGARIITSD